MLRQRRDEQRQATTPPPPLLTSHPNKMRPPPLICLSVAQSAAAVVQKRRCSRVHLQQAQLVQRNQRKPSAAQLITLVAAAAVVAASLNLLEWTPISMLASQAGLLVAAEANVEVTANQQGATNEQAVATALLVDTRYWARNLELGERDNWRSNLKPCTLLERVLIQANEAVVSLGDSLDALGTASLEANVRDLALAQDGVLLLEEDTLSVGTLDPLFIEYLNNSGDCLDSSLRGDQGEGQMIKMMDSNQQQALFEFEPDPNSMSWFNPDNWQTEAYAQEQFLHTLVPDAHRVPCNGDVVVFGDRNHAFWPLLMGEERAKLVPFKVNFRPASEAGGSGAQQPAFNATRAPLSSLRVSKLKIGERSYSQQEFDQLNAAYGNQLFTFHEPQSVFGPQPLGDGLRQEVLLVDESSIQPNSESLQELCHEEAGCVCGNEQAEVMQIICSFHYPANAHHLPCRDPIQVPGYCDQICATSLTISMEPSKFRESLLANDIRKVGESLATSDGPQGGRVFVGPRRVDHNRYEIVYRLMPADQQGYESILGMEIEFARQIKQLLEKAATKSFYGIRSVSIRSSIDWRRNNRASILWATFAFASSVFLVMFAHNDKLFSIKPLMSAWDLIKSRLEGATPQHRPSSSNSDNNLSAFVMTGASEQPPILDQDELASELVSQSGLREVYEDSTLARFDTCSITDSTHDLIDTES